MTSRGPIVITGFMACGKTEVARLLARRLNLSVADLDELITKNEGSSPAVLIRTKGEQAFRRIETSSLSTLLNKSEVGVIALGGGAWIESTNRDLLARSQATVVWLDTPFDVCWERIEASTDDRPLGTSREQASKLYKFRRPIYELAGIRIVVRPDDTLDKLAARIEGEMSLISLREVKKGQ